MHSGREDGVAICILFFGLAKSQKSQKKVNFNGLARSFVVLSTSQTLNSVTGHIPLRHALKIN
jgi:hypothetical protein